MIAHRRHMRWGKLIEDTRPKYMGDWETSFSTVLHYHVKNRSDFVQFPTETDTAAPTPCVYCKKKVKIPVEAPLLQADHHCGGPKRHSIETEGVWWSPERVPYYSSGTSNSGPRALCRPC